MRWRAWTTKPRWLTVERLAEALDATRPKRWVPARAAAIRAAILSGASERGDG